MPLIGPLCEWRHTWRQTGLLASGAFMLFKVDVRWDLICYSERIRLGIAFFFVTATMDSLGGGGGEILSWRNERYHMLRFVFKNA